MCRETPSADASPLQQELRAELKTARGSRAYCASPGLVQIYSTQLLKAHSSTTLYSKGQNIHFILEIITPTQKKRVIVLINVVATSKFKQ